MSKSERATSLFAVGVMFFFLFAIGLRVFTRFVLVERFKLDNQFTKLVFFDAKNLTAQTTPWRSVDWASMYPFPQEQEPSFETEPPRAQRKTARLEEVKSQIKNVERCVEEYASEHLLGRRFFAGCARYYERVVQWNYASFQEYNGLVRTKDDYWTWVISPVDMKDHADSVVSLADFCRDLEIPFMYFNVPDKVCRFEDQDISGIIDFSNQNADSLLKSLRSNGIETYDVREYFHSENRSHHEYFFRTDHHWLPDSGRRAARFVASTLNERHGFHFDLSLLDADKMTTRNYPAFFLGTQGRKVTTLNAKPEDFSLIYPKYPTQFHYEVLSRGIDSVGDFSIMYDMSYLEARDWDWNGKSPYSTYMYDNQPLERVENRQVANDDRVLIIHDSFGLCSVPFLTLGIRHVDSLDVRFFDGSLRRFIEVERPDVVVVMYNSHVIGNVDLFQFR